MDEAIAAVSSPSAGLARTVRLAVDPNVRGRIAAIAAGRTLVVDYYATRCCTSVWVGDLAVSWRDADVEEIRTAELEPVDGVRVVADRHLLDVLAVGEPVLTLAGPSFARHLAVRLDRPEVWIAFLESPRIARRRL